MKLEIKSNWNLLDSQGKPIFTITLKKENGEDYYCAYAGECFADEYKTYMTLIASFFELLHIAYPECAKQEVEEMKKIVKETQL